MQAAAELLNVGKRVTILAGAGCEGAHDEVVAVAEALAAPVVHAMRGKEFVEYENPNDVGMTGLAPARSIRNRSFAVHERDGLVWSGEMPQGEPPHFADGEVWPLRPIRLPTT